MIGRCRDGAGERWRGPLGFVAVLWVGLCTGPAHAQNPVELALPSGSLYPGIDNVVEIGAVDSAGLPVRQAPSVSADGQRLKVLGQVRTGVWSYRVPVAVDAREVDFGLFVDGRRTERTVEVFEPLPSNLEMPRRTDMAAGAETVEFDVLGEDLPPANALQVVVSEGQVQSVERLDDRLRVTLTLLGDPTPRVVPVGVMDRRNNELPAWGVVRVWARPLLPLESEPGATVTVRVGSRDYGPWTTNEQGTYDAVVDQYPGERAAIAEFVDDLGNVSMLEIPLAVRARPTLMAFQTRDRVPGGAPEAVYIRATSVGGYAWTGGAPSCRTPVGTLDLRSLGSGIWMTTLPVLSADFDEELRLDCGLPEQNVAVRATIRAAEGIPSRLRLRVWPQDLRSDYPYAEVRAVLEDASGERLPASGIELTAERGDVVVSERRPTQVRGEYDGAEVGESGQDTLKASWSGASGGGLADRLQLAWDEIPRAGRARVHVRAQDVGFQGVEGERVRLNVGGQQAEVVTGPDGWATAELAAPVEARLWTMSATLRGLRTEAVVHRGQEALTVPHHDLSVEVPLTVTPGRIAGISVQVDPPELRVAPGAVAFIYVNLEDGEGNPIVDEQVELSVEEGEIGEIRVRPDGTLVAEYRPAAVSGARQVEVTASTSALRSTTQVSLVPRLLRLSLGPWAGVTTNFSGMASPVVGVDIDTRVRSRLTGEALIFRFGVAQYNHRQQADTGLGGSAVLSAAWVPISSTVLIRRDQGRWGFWGGGGGVAVVERLQAQFGDLPEQTGTRLLVGPTAQVGVGLRWVGGEFGLSVRSSFVARQPEEVGFSGNVGGVASGLAYRLVF